MKKSINEIKKEIERKGEITRAVDDITDEIIRISNWYMVDDPNSEDGKREPMDTEDEHYNYLRYEACCVAIEALRNMIDK